MPPRIILFDEFEKDGAFGCSSLFRFVRFEKGAGFFKVEGISVYDYLVFAGVCGNGDDAVYTVTMLAKSLNDEIDIYHG